MGINATRIELADGKVVQMVYGPISERKYFSITYAALVGGRLLTRDSQEIVNQIADELPIVAC